MLYSLHLYIRRVCYIYYIYTLEGCAIRMYYIYTLEGCAIFITYVHNRIRISSNCVELIFGKGHLSTLGVSRDT